MTLTITLTPETEQKLAEQARRSGRDIAALASELIERVLLAGPTMDEILAPFRRQVADSGLSDDELDALFQEQREEAWREKQR
jgi:hypothetical protein